MKAVVYQEYGSPEVLELREVDKPTLTEGDVRVRVHAASVGAGDWHLLTATWFAVRLYQGLFRPKRKILGHDVAGTVEAVGGKVTQFQPGDEVFGESNGAGAFAEYVCVPDHALVLKPASLTYEEAAAVPVSALTALQGLRDKGRIQPGQRVLINGASGGVGSFAVQIAKSFGAEVTGVCSTRKLEMVRSIGADQVIDYSQEDFTKGDRRYDLVLDNVGNRPLADCRRTLRPEGIYVAVSGAPTRSLWVAMTGGKRMVSFISQPNQKDLDFIKELLETGKVTPVIDRRYPLREVPMAMRYFGEGHVQGKVVITV
ncbi:MAG: NAD(P)-dependent alcohol dehydrogenase [Planctomycetota bacterium]|jgi:NADPH:quinone reductase-like Zn-dependent oxidoreductase